MGTPENVLTLSALPSGSVAEVVAIRAGCGLQGRLLAMGFHRGVQVRIVQNRHRGPLIVDVNGSRIALGRGMAEKVLGRLVSPCPSNGSGDKPPEGGGMPSAPV